MANNFPALKQQLMTPAVRKSLEARIGDKTGTFITSVLNLCGQDKNLAECNPTLIVREALKAAALSLPIDKNLGFAYIIPYKDKAQNGAQIPNFQMGYKGYIQLALRTGQYKHLNTGIVYEGEEMVVDRIRGTLAIKGEAVSEKATGYFVYMQLVNGFEKAIGWSAEKVENHAKKYSKNYRSKYGTPTIWQTDFNSMALKTMILQLVPKYGPMTIEMAEAMSYDQKAEDQDTRISNEIADAANSDFIDITPGGPEESQINESEEMTDEEKAAIIAEEARMAMEAENNVAGPGF